MKTSRNLHALIGLIRQFGLRWLLFRIGYFIRMRTGIIRWQMPAYKWESRPLSYWLKPSVPSEPGVYQQWRTQHEPKFFFDQVEPVPQTIQWDNRNVVLEAQNYLNGITKYFSKTDFKVGFPPDWLADPHNDLRIPADEHWSRIPDDGPYEIKYVWEASRFTQIYTLVRAYAVSHDEDYPEAFWAVVEDWMQKNPPGMGPNWKCGQEATLRLMGLCFGYYAFRQHPLSTPARVAKLTVLAAALAERIYKNIDYAIFTFSNHSISESFGIWLAGLLFPELKNAEKYLQIGKKILEEQADKQIFSDGSYAMHSLNYHRFVLHIYVYALRLGELNDQKLSPTVYQAVERSLDYLYQLIEPTTGQMPQYGANDGALVLPLNTCDFSDYRPLIQLGQYLINGRRVFPAGPWDEDLFWLFGKDALKSTVNPMVQKPAKVFPDAGMSKISGLDSRAFIRCGSINSRPSHADQNHFDLWWYGKNIALDAGTYLYHGDAPWGNGLARTKVHNAVTVDRQDQMARFSRFIWVDWAQGKVLAHKQESGLEYWQGEHDGYLRLRDPVVHKRSVFLVADLGWLVVDHLAGLTEHEVTLNWLLEDQFSPITGLENAYQLTEKSEVLHAQFGVIGSAVDHSAVRADPESTRGWVSSYYGHKEQALSLQLTAKHTKASLFWSWFGPPSFMVSQQKDSLKISDGDSSIILNNHMVLFKSLQEGPELIINPFNEKFQHQD